MQQEGALLGSRAPCRHRLGVFPPPPANGGGQGADVNASIRDAALEMHLNPRIPHPANSKHHTSPLKLVQPQPPPSTRQCEHRHNRDATPGWAPAIPPPPPSSSLRHRPARWGRGDGEQSWQPPLSSPARRIKRANMN